MNAGKALAMLVAAAWLAATPAMAAKWVQISTIEYLDTDSVQRSGNVVTYNLFTVTGDARPTQETVGDRYKLDCKTREEEALDAVKPESEVLKKDEAIYQRLCRKH